MYEIPMKYSGKLLAPDGPGPKAAPSQPEGRYFTAIIAAMGKPKASQGRTPGARAKRAMSKKATTTVVT